MKPLMSSSLILYLQVVLLVARRLLILPRYTIFHLQHTTSVVLSTTYFVPLSTAFVPWFHACPSTFAPPETVSAFEQEMQQAGADYQLISYPGVKHSFTNPGADSFAKRFGMPLAYDKHADEDSWQRTRAFFNEIFKD